MSADIPVESLIFDHTICGVMNKILIVRISADGTPSKYMITNKYFSPDNKFIIFFTFAERSLDHMETLLPTDRLIKNRQMFLEHDYPVRITRHFESSTSPYEASEELSELSAPYSKAAQQTLAVQLHA
ncbi:MAG: hypothetical protein WC997_04720 [Porticoccaceae bacterium]